MSALLFLIFNLAVFYVIYWACKEDEGSSQPDLPSSKSHLY